MWPDGYVQISGVHLQNRCSTNDYWNWERSYWYDCPIYSKGAISVNRQGLFIPFDHLTHYQWLVDLFLPDVYGRSHLLFLQDTMESSKIAHPVLFFHSGWPIISSEHEKEIQGHAFKDTCSVMPVLIALDSLCLQIQAFTEQLYLLCPEAFLYSGQVSLLSTNISKFCRSCIPGRLFRNNFEESIHYSMSLRERPLYTISNLLMIYSPMIGTSRKHTHFLWLLVVLTPLKNQVICSELCHSKDENQKVLVRDI